jgi:hypothetical protein
MAQKNISSAAASNRDVLIFGAPPGLIEQLLLLPLIASAPTNH